MEYVDRIWLEYLGTQLKSMKEREDSSCAEINKLIIEQWLDSKMRGTLTKINKSNSVVSQDSTFEVKDKFLAMQEKYQQTGRKNSGSMFGSIFMSKEERQRIRDEEDRELFQAQGSQKQHEIYVSLYPAKAWTNILKWLNVEWKAFECPNEDTEAREILILMERFRRPLALTTSAVGEVPAAKRIKSDAILC